MAAHATKEDKHFCPFQQPTKNFVFLIEKKWNMYYLGVSKTRDTQNWMVYNGKPYWNGGFGENLLFSEQPRHQNR